MINAHTSTNKEIFKTIIYVCALPNRNTQKRKNKKKTNASYQCAVNRNANMTKHTCLILGHRMFVSKTFPFLQIQSLFLYFKACTYMKTICGSSMLLFYSLQNFHISIKWGFFSKVWVTASLVGSLRLFWIYSRWF